MIGRNEIAFMACFLFLCLFMACADEVGEERFYELVTYPVPDGLSLEISGMATLPDGRLAVCVRRGEIWLISDPENPENPQFDLFASGLHEPMGLSFHNNAFYTVQRTELTEIKDSDGDGLAESYRTVAKGWGVTGNYHEYGYGPQFDRKGNAWLTLNCTIGQGFNPQDNAWRGWSLVVSPDGQWRPVSGGFRSPCGLGMDSQGEIFVTDQQGNWFPTCALIHVRDGVFHGHADALKFTHHTNATFKWNHKVDELGTVVEAARRYPPYELPAVWFPYRKMGMSATDILCDTTAGRFGPFRDQLFVGEFTMSFISRVFLERVNGVYQGACFRFREGLQCAAFRLAWGEEGRMFIGQTNRGWNSLGNRSYGLQSLKWTGKTPFEILSMSAAVDGFELTFTRPIDLSGGLHPDWIAVKSYTYPYHSAYGGDETDLLELKVRRIIPDQDGLKLRLIIDGLREGFVHELDAGAIRSESGEPLLHSQAYYTLNQIPGSKETGF